MHDIKCNTIVCQATSGADSNAVCHIHCMLVYLNDALLPVVLNINVIIFESRELAYSVHHGII